ncbi:MAG TPA: NUDIX domain-containing protein [Alphaproteobacteria bacterium]|nr:NUDIX domain-containing protein [Alphaproteobacteria bacterium]
MAAETPELPPADRLVETIPKGDTHLRKVCPDCGYIKYDNPKIITGAVCLWDDGGGDGGQGEAGELVLLCRRAIPPRVGFWTIPAGYLEQGESTAQGAVRETMEEAGAAVAVESLIGVYEIPHISQIYVIHRARMLRPEYAPGEESQETALFAWANIPWDALAFPSVTWALERYGESRSGTVPPIHYVAPSEIMK